MWKFTPKAVSQRSPSPVPVELCSWQKEGKGSYCSLDAVVPANSTSCPCLAASSQGTYTDPIFPPLLANNLSRLSCSGKSTLVPPGRPPGSPWLCSQPGRENCGDPQSLPCSPHTPHSLGVCVLSIPRFRGGEAEAQRGRNLPGSHSWRDGVARKWSLPPVSMDTSIPSDPSPLRGFTSGIRWSRTCRKKVRNARRPSPGFLAPAH